MELINKQSITIDFYKSRMLPYYSFYQHDTNQIEFHIEENGTVPDLSGVSRAVVNIRRPDRKVVSRQLEINGNKILYDLGHEEMKVSGEALLTLQLYNEDGQRLSTAKIKFYIESTVEANVEFKDKQGTLYQQIIFEMEGLKDQLFTLNKLTTEQADYAKEQGDAAKTAAEVAIQETENLDEMKTATVEATGAANTAAEAATTAAETAETNAEHAKTQGDYAKEQADNAAQRTEELNGVDAAQFKDRQDQFSAQLAEKAGKNEFDNLSTDVSIRIAEKADKLTTATKDYVTEKIVEVNTGGTVDISSKASVTYVDEMNGINDFTTVPIRENGIVVAIEERQGSTVISRTTINRNSAGEVVSTSKTINGKTVISRYNKENGQLVSISKTLGGNE